MKFEIEFERTYPHPVGAVWRALTEPDALGAWLMDTNFVPEQGREFQMWCRNQEGDTDTYLCRVVEIEPPYRMLWSWILDGMQGQQETYVEFKLKEVSDGTHLTVRHSGDRDRTTVEKFKDGWPVKLQQLAETLTESESR